MSKFIILNIKVYLCII